MEYEKYQSRVDKGRKNMKRSDKDNTALAKAEQELYHASEVIHSPARRRRELPLSAGGQGSESSFSNIQRPRLTATS